MNGSAREQRMAGGDRFIPILVVSSLTVIIQKGR